MNRRQTARSGGSPVFGVFVLTVGIVLLLNVLGVAPWEIWFELWRWWPLALVLVGAGLLLRRVHPVAMTIVTAGVVAAAVAFSWATVEGSIGPYNTSTTTFAERIESAGSATLNIDFGAGGLAVSSLPQQSDFLVDAIFEDRPGGPRTTVERHEDTATIDVTHPAGRPWFRPTTGRREWEIYLHPDIDYSIDIDGGASNYDLDFENLNVSEITLDTGASSIDMTLPDRDGETALGINGGASRIDIKVPEGVAARIQIAAGLSSVNIDENRFPKIGSEHVSEGFDTAEKRVRIVINAGVSRINIR